MLFLTATDAYLEESLPVKSIKPSLNSVREHEISSTREYPLRELAASIHQHGLLCPIIVRPIEDGFEIVAGNRRFDACRLLHWKYIAAKVRELSEKEAFEIQLIENIQRMTMNPIEEARAFKKYTTEYGWGGESELARIVSRSEQYVSNRIQLLRLPKTITDEICRSRLKVSHALEIINLDEKEQEIINNAIIAENLTVRDIREITKHSKLNKIKRVRDHGNGENDHSHYAHLLDNITLDRNTDSWIQQARLLQKAQLSLRISLYRLDALIHECNDKLNANSHSEVSDLLMQFRLKIHSIMDDNLRAIAKLKK